MTTSNVSFLRGATQGNVTSQRERTVPEMTHAQPWLPSPTADPHSHDCYMNTSYSMHNTHTRLPVNDNDVTSIATIGTFEAFFFVPEIKHAPERAWFWITPGHPSDSDDRTLITVLSESGFWQFFRTWHRLSRKASKFIKFWQKEVKGLRYQRHDCSGCCNVMDVTNQVEL